MPKLSLAASAALALLTTTAQGDTYFRGLAYVTETVGNCPWAAVGDRFNASYHPYSIPGGVQSKPMAAINVYWDYGSSYHSLAAPFTTVYQTTNDGGIGWTDFVEDLHHSAVLVESATPPLSATTPFSVIVAKIKNPSNQAQQTDCEITIRLAGLRG